MIDKLTDIVVLWRDRTILNSRNIDKILKRQPLLNSRRELQSQGFWMEGQAEVSSSAETKVLYISVYHPNLDFDAILE
jgi:hypothetical protein